MVERTLAGRSTAARRTLRVCSPRTSYLWAGLTLATVLAGCLSPFAYGAALEHQVGRFCAETQHGAPIADVDARARAMWLHVRPTVASTGADGAVTEGELAYRDLLFLRWYCFVEHQEGRVIRAETGFAQGT